jgi:hypothetical protein
MAAAMLVAEEALAIYAKNLEFLAEEAKIRHELRPRLATASRLMLDLGTMAARDYSVLMRFSRRPRPRSSAGSAEEYLHGCRLSREPAPRFHDRNYLQHRWRHDP